MGKILSLLLGLAVVAYVGYRTMYGRGGSNPEGAAPQQRLQNARDAAKRIEDEQAKAAEEALKKATPTE